VLVAAPSIATDNWAHECRRWLPERTVSVQRARRTFRWPRAGELRSMSYGMLPPSAREIADAKLHAVAMEAQWTQADQRRHRARVARLERERKRLTLPWPNTVLVADEAQFLKNPSATRTKRWRELAALVYRQGGRIWILTGTPLENRYDELWSVLQAAGLGSSIFGSRGAFRGACAIGGSAGEKLRTATLRRLRYDVLPDLPRKRREIRLVRLDPATRKECDDLVAALRGRGVVLEQATLEEIKRAQEDAGIAAHVSQTRVALAKAKLPYALDFVTWMEGEGEPVVVFCSHRAPIDLLGARPGWTAITGDEDQREKFRRARGFQEGRYRGVAISTRAASTAINLDRAWRSLWIDLEWTPAKIDQGEDRLLRLTQKAASVLHTRLVADHPLERRIEFLLREKQERIDNVVNASAVRAENPRGAQP